MKTLKLSNRCQIIIDLRKLQNQIDFLETEFRCSVKQEKWELCESLKKQKNHLFQLMQRLLKNNDMFHLTSFTKSHGSRFVG